MSTNYRFTEEFSKEQVLEAMKPLGLEVSKSKDADNTQFCITDGDCYIWAYHGEDGNNVEFCRYGSNYDAEENIVAPLADALQTDYLSEHDDGFFEDEDEDSEEEE
jgi:hypothetical protein